MIVCSGDALVDMLPRELPDGTEAFLPVPGGALFITAVALGRLGERTAFLSGLSTDMFGRKLADYLEESGVDIEYCVRSERPTTLAFVELVDGNARYSFVDENTAGRMLQIDSLPDLPRDVDTLHCGGISLVAEPCGSAFEELVRRMSPRTVVSLDPNIRPSFVVDEARYRDRLTRMIAMSDIVKVSEEDLAWLEPHADFETLAHTWLNEGVSIATLTLGENGTRSITRTLDIRVPALPAKVVDTVGAGDSFNAGFLSRLRELGVLEKPSLKRIDRETLQSALEFGALVASRTCGQAGATPPWKRELEVA